MIPSIETQSRIAELRQKALTNTISLEEMKEAIRFLRASRMSAAQAPKKASTKGARAAKSGEELLQDLENF